MSTGFIEEVLIKVEPDCWRDELLDDSKESETEFVGVHDTFSLCKRSVKDEPKDIKEDEIESPVKEEPKECVDFDEDPIQEPFVTIGEQADNNRQPLNKLYKAHRGSSSPSSERVCRSILDKGTEKSQLPLERCSETLENPSETQPNERLDDRRDSPYDEADPTSLILPESPSEKRPYRCGFCSYSAIWKCNLKQHSRIHTGERPFKCLECSYSAIDLSALNQHTQIHTGNRPYKCGNCSYSTNKRGNLKKHLRIHSGEKPFKCKLCSYSATDKSALNRHSRIHSGEKPFKCGHCSYSISKKCKLEKHLQMHLGERPFKCKECSYSVFTKTDLNRHLRIHLIEKTFKCPDCSYSSYKKCNLKRHARIHCVDKPFKCELCPFATVDKFSFKRHLGTHSSQRAALKHHLDSGYGEEDKETCRDIDDVLSATSGHASVSSPLGREQRDCLEEASREELEYMLERVREMVKNNPVTNAAEIPVTEMEQS